MEADNNYQFNKFWTGVENMKNVDKQGFSNQVAIVNPEFNNKPKQQEFIHIRSDFTQKEINVLYNLGENFNGLLKELKKIIPPELKSILTIELDSLIFPVLTKDFSSKFLIQDKLLFIKEILDNILEHYFTDGFILKENLNIDSDLSDCKLKIINLQNQILAGLELTGEDKDLTLKELDSIDLNTEHLTSKQLKNLSFKIKGVESKNSEIFNLSNNNQKFSFDALEQKDIEYLINQINQFNNLQNQIIQMVKLSNISLNSIDISVLVTQLKQPNEMISKTDFYNLIEPKLKMNNQENINKFLLELNNNISMDSNSALEIVKIKSLFDEMMKFVRNLRIKTLLAKQPISANIENFPPVQ